MNDQTDLWLYEVPIPPRVKALVAIYALVHPDSHQVVYVGQSNAPATRFNDHIRSWQREHQYIPRMQVIEEVPESKADEREQHFIDMFISTGLSILNYQARESHHKTGKFIYSIDDMRKIAAFHGGKCLSDSYDGHVAKLIWECKHGHVWEAVPTSIIQGSWCANMECKLKRRTLPRTKFTKLPRRKH